jgi:hypothetical protein
MAAHPPMLADKPSGNQEVALATLGSLSIHVGIAVLLVLLFNFVIPSARDNGMEVETYVEGNPLAGGGGEGGGIGDQPPMPKVERASADELPPGLTPPNVALGQLPEVLAPVPDLPLNSDADRIFEGANTARSDLDKVGRVDPATGKNAGGGRGGPGSGGGKGPGKGVGEGTGTQPGKQGSITQRRNKRWTITFDTRNGSDYLRQLNLLGATLVADFAEGGPVMYRKLTQFPVPPEKLDSSLNSQLRWVDNRPGAVRELAEAMGLQRNPLAIRAYFPARLESELLQLELAYRNKKEEEIDSTVFRMVLEGNSYRLYVTEQRLN